MERNSHKIPDSVIRVNRHMANDIARHGHPATFSVEFARTFIQSWPGIVYDPFLGSGTTIIAAEISTPSRCYGMEIDSSYCDISVLRWQTYTGQQATLESTGETYAETAANRAHVAQKPESAPKRPKPAKRASKPRKAAE